MWPPAALRSELARKQQSQFPRVPGDKPQLVVRQRLAGGRRAELDQGEHQVLLALGDRDSPARPERAGTRPCRRTRRSAPPGPRARTSRRGTARAPNRRKARSSPGPSAPRRRGCPTRARTRCGRPRARRAAAAARTRTPPTGRTAGPRTGRPDPRSPSPMTSLIPNPYRNARMHDSRSALPARSPIPFTHVLIQASWPASRSPSAPDTEFATAMPRSLWQCVSIGMPTAEASLANRSLIRAGESPPMVSQYRTRDAPASLAASANSSRYPSSVRDPSSALTPMRVRVARLRQTRPPRNRDGRRHLLDDRGAVQLAAELVRDHLVRGGDRQVVMPQARPGGPDRHGGLDVGRDGPAPAGQPQVAERARLRQRQAGPDVGRLVEQEREPDLGLRHPQPPQVEVDHHLAELRQPRPRGLHPVPVGHVKKVDRWHTSRLTK